MWLRLVLASLLAYTAASQSCAPGFSRYQNSCYYVVASRLSWASADKYCASIVRGDLSVRLVSVESSGEDNFVVNLIRQDTTARNRDNWMSLTSIDKRRGWVWAATQNNAGYTNWRSGGPSSSGKCAYFSEYYSGRWYNGDCTTERSFVCEYNLFGQKEVVEEQSQEVEGTQQNCRFNFLQYGRSCYYILPSSLNWAEAEHYCSLLSQPLARYNVHLASIESSGEAAYLRDRLNADSLYRGRQYWTSGNTMDPIERWRWARNQRQLTYTNWASGEPNGSGKCIQLWSSRNYQWDDATCYNTPSNHGFICEYET